MLLRNLKKTLIPLFAILASLPFHVKLAQSLDSAKLDEYFNVLETNDRFMGSIAILKEGKMLYINQVGYSDIRTKQRPDGLTKYRIGSVSKVYTAVLTLKAVEDGKLKLDQVIDSFFPSIANAGQITISDMLHHRSGIHNFTENKTQYQVYHTNPRSEKEMVAIISEGGSDFEPGTRSEYSNSNYVLLSFILSRVYQKPFSQVLKEIICEPLGLTGTYFGQKIQEYHNESNGYEFNKEWLRTSETDPSVSMGAGGIVSTPVELALFAHALFSNQVLSAESMSRMKQITDQYGMGLFQTNYTDKVSYGHNGEIDGFKAVLRYFEDGQYVIAVMSNASRYPMNSITVALVRSLYNLHFDIPDFRIYQPASKELKQYTGTYSSDSFPVNIKVTRRGKKLRMRGDGDSKMTLQASARHEFRYDPAGISIRFITEKHLLIIRQGGKTSVLFKEGYYKTSKRKI